MHVDRTEIEKLHAEAKRIRRNFRYIQDDLKRSPENVDLLRQRDALKKKYADLTAVLANLKEPESALGSETITPAPAPPPAVDMSVFEPKPFEVPAAVVIKQRARGPAAKITFRDIRNVVGISILLVILPVYYLMYMKDLSFYEVPSRSMEPTLLVGDRIASIVPGAYRRGDVVVLPDLQNPGDFLVKRLVALGGDTVEVANERLFVNSQPIAEPYLKEPPHYVLPPTIVAEGEVFLLGDNRNESDDSHVWGGGRPSTDLKGRVFYIYSPSGRRGTLPDHAGAFQDVHAP